MLEEAKREFDLYVNNYDMNVREIKLKYDHSYRVMEYCISISVSLGLDNEEKSIMGLIGLLHDIGRFEQWSKYKTFMDNKSIDHGDLSVSILFDDNYIRKFIKDDKYDEIIRKGIKYHNKFEIGECNDKELLFSKIVRDADKIDIFDVLLYGYSRCNIKGFDMTDKVYNDSINRKPINYKDVVNDLDKKILGICCVYDLNFDYSFKILKENDSVNKLIDVLVSRLDDIKVIDKINNIKNNINGFIDERC